MVYVAELLDGKRARFDPDTATLLGSGEGWTLYRTRHQRYIIVEEDEGELDVYEIAYHAAVGMLEDADQLSDEGRRVLDDHIQSLPEA
ncbi:MAG: hypothetical protein KatS3mg023_1816 [Armatimonadota bacterium]|nr:MAG: hypothetical protein KatS3mg023_1816 [Armatimonadota bacterium]